MIKSFNQLNKNLKRDYSTFTKIPIALLGDSSTQLLNKSLAGQAIEMGYQLDIYEADYNQIDLQIFNQASEFYTHEVDFVVISETCQKLKKKFYDLPLEERKFFAENKINHLKKTINQIISNKNIKSIVYFNFQEEDDSIFGNFANNTEYSFLYQIRKLNYELMNLAQSDPAFFILDYKLIHQRLGDKTAFSPQLLINNDMTLSLDVLPYVSKNVLDIILVQTGVFKKCLILDLDNTMWGGIIGDDGIEKIQIGNLGIGKAFTNFQLWAKELKERGVILAVCSKNFEDVAKNVFINHPEMIIRLDDISVFVANWESKAENIKYIQSVLNIGFDSMVFIDDNKFERELVKNSIPEITVPNLPVDPAEYVEYLKTLNLFETNSFVKNDTKRTKQYQEESERKKIAQKFNSETDFLKELEMKATITEFNNFNFPRIAQLIQRSNQFNLRTIRYSEQELNDIQNSDNYKCLSISLKDKYGDYGIISVVILKHQQDELFIDTWIMSCRVLKRGVEDFVLNQIVKYAKSNTTIKKITGEFIPTKKNIFVKDLFNNLGFKKTSKLWELEISEFKNKDNFITLNKD